MTFWSVSLSSRASTSLACFSSVKGQMIAFDRGFEKTHEHIAVGREVATVDGKAAVQPGDTLRIEVGDNAQSHGDRLGSLRLAQHSRRNGAIAERRQALCSNFLHDDILACHAKTAQDERCR